MENKELPEYGKYSINDPMKTPEYLEKYGTNGWPGGCLYFGIIFAFVAGMMFVAFWLGN